MGSVVVDGVGRLTSIKGDHLRSCYEVLFWSIEKVHDRYHETVLIWRCLGHFLEHARKVQSHVGV